MEKRLQLWSPVWGWLATKEGESVDLKGQDLVLYEAAIQEALEQEKLYYRKKSAPFNLMDYYDADDSVKEKVQNLDIQVKKEQDGLYVCASLALIEPLTQQELEAIQNFLSRQYEGGIFDTSRIRTYSVEEGEVVFDFSVDTKEKFSQKEVQCETQKKYEITSIAHPQFPWLHRIRALVDVNEAVPKGTLGGFVEYEQNLSQEGSCWIYDQAICCERAVVERSAGLFQEAIAKETLDTNTYGQTKGRSGSYSVNFQQSGRELLTPDEVRLLDNRKAVLLVRGERPILDEKYDMHKHVNVKYTEDGGAPPYDYAKAPLSHEDVTIDTRRLDDYELLSAEEILGREQSF